MTFQELVPQNWDHVDIHYINGTLQFDNLDNPLSEQGWTYVYELHHGEDPPKVVYIGNTKERFIRARVNPELNHQDVINELPILLRDPTRQLQNTNMRLTRKFHNLCQDGAASLRLYYLNEFDTQVAFHHHDIEPLFSSLSFQIGDQVIGANLLLMDVITWLPKVIQGIGTEHHNPIVSLEKCLLLKHAIEEDKLPRANLGFR
jgi:hypothetical protein